MRMLISQILDFKMFSLLLIILMSVDASQPRCGYDSCPKPKEGMLNVHFVPHTHNDVGWLKTVDQYYYGSRNDIQRAGVQYIIDSVVAALLEDEERRFIYVESAFFWRWWNEQTDAKKDIVRGLVNEGRLEFIGGGWSMNDEAAAHYTAIIDNMSFGVGFFQGTFGKCGRPKIAWQIDPFGHGREQANLFARMGYDGLFFGRLDYQDREKRMGLDGDPPSMEMIWRGDPSDSGAGGELFTGALFHAYSPPPGFCFDSLCTDVLMDDPNLEDYNMDVKVIEFLTYAKVQAASYTTNNVIMTMGEDFNYMNANMWFKNMDKLRNYFNKNSSYGLNILYSTPSCYLKAVHDAAEAGGQTWTTKTDDFFPYASDPHAYWTGYFTSRPALKGMIRQANSLLQAAKQVHSRMPVGQGDSEMHLAKRAVAVNQHHDAVTGTAKQHVTDDYALRLHTGMEACRKVMADGLRADLGTSCDLSSHCPFLNISQCAFTESRSSFTLLVYNPQAKEVSTFLRLPVETDHTYSVRDSSGRAVRSQVVPLPEEVFRVPGRASTARFELVLEAKNLPGLGSTTFSLERTREKEKYAQRLRVGREGLTLRSGGLTLELTDRGGIKRITRDRTDIHVHQEFAYYEGAVGDNMRFIDRASGAYIFRPTTEAAKLVGEPQSAHFIKGDLVQEVHQRFNGWLSQVIRLYAGRSDLELEWMVGPLPLRAHNMPGLEVISRYTTDIDSGNLFSTDSNGRGMIQRQRDFRETWTLNLTEPVSANYYPVVSRMALEEGNSVRVDKKQAWVMTDRAEGGSSLQAGQMELMLHRRLFNDDAFGVGEPLNETAFGRGLVVRGVHKLLLCTEDCEAASRAVAEDQLMKPVVFFGDSCTNPPKSDKSILLPAGVKLVTLERWTGNSTLVRLENLRDDAVTLDLEEFLSWAAPAEERKVEVMSLDGSLDLETMRKERLVWRHNSGAKKEEEEENTVEEGKTYNIDAKQILTLLVS